MKKFISVLLAVIMIMSVVPMGIISFAEVNEYPYRSSMSLLQKSEYGFYIKDCMDYIAWKLNTSSGIEFHRNFRGLLWDAVADWDENAAQLGYTVDNTPAVGAVAYIEPNEERGTLRGQLAWVRAFLPDGRVCFETYNWGTASRDYLYFEDASTWADGYIHFKDLDEIGYPRNLMEITATPGRYVIVNVASGLVMTYGGELADVKYCPMVLRPLKETTDQLFSLRHSAAGKYTIELNHKDGGVVNIWRDKGEKAQKGDLVTAFTKTMNDQLQQFYFTPVGNDCYIIQSYTDIQKVISASALGNNAMLVVDDYDPNDARQIWTLMPYKDYTVTLSPNGGTCDVKKITVAYRSEYGELPIAIKTGYTFIGWYTEKEGGEHVTETTINNINADHTLYAHWFYEAHMDLDGDDKCDDCGADAQTFCTCMCHKTSLLPRLIYKFILLFWKLLNVVDNKYCDCGKPHWGAVETTVK